MNGRGLHFSAFHSFVGYPDGPSPFNHLRVLGHGNRAVTMECFISIVSV